jgi:Mlc titration factor MtfA (ptsG expression regulator)
MFFSWLRNRRRRRILAKPFPPAWLEVLNQNVPLYGLLAEAEQATLRDDLRIFAAEKNWEGCGGLVLTDEMRVTIAAHACLLLLGIDHDSFERVYTILVYPSGFRSPEGWQGPDGVVHTDVGLLGEAWLRGPVILAWDDVLAGARNARDGRNVVLHEFAHQVDYLDGVADGTPPLRSREQYRRWHDVMTAEYTRLAEESEHGRPQVLDAYGATNPAEFFAVATECFFEKPLQMKHRHPQLYDVLREYYCQDTARRVAPEPGEEGRPVCEPRPERNGWLWRKRRSCRRSRAAPPAKTFEQEVNGWPGWVTWWGFHPGRTREEAQRYLDRHFILLVGFALVLGMDLVVTRGFSFPKLVGLPLAALLSGTAVWLYLAIRWIDRHGRWAGQAKKSHGEGTG